VRPIQWFAITTNMASLPYKVEKIDISKNTQKEDWFLAINPNGRVPALTDKFTDGETINLFESGSIMQYLVERYDTEYKISHPKGSREWFEMNNWLFFQNAGVGPMQGQASTYLPFVFVFCIHLLHSPFISTFWITFCTRLLYSPFVFDSRPLYSPLEIPAF
jgi:hypothetical protein